MTVCTSSAAITTVLAATMWLGVATSVHAEPEPTPPSEPTTVEVTDEPSTPTPTNSEPDLAKLHQRLDALERELAEVKAAQASKDAADEKPPEATSSVITPPSTTRTAANAGDSADNRSPDYADGFHFGTYGRVVAGGDHRGRAGRDADITAYGSRLDASTYAELELRREDYWKATGAYTRVVATVAFQAPVFHYNADFAAKLAIRNLYIEESGLGLKNLKVWIGSRMYRGDDIYLLNFWPLDNLNTMGGGLSYEFIPNLVLKLHSGINQPANSFFGQTSQRPAPLGQVGDTTVRILDRQKSISSAKLSHIFSVGKTGGIKPVLYGEFHYVPKGQRELETQRYQSLPDDKGFVVGAQLGLFTGQRSTHLNLVARYARGIAAYGEFNAPSRLAVDRSSKGAREILLAMGGNYEVGPFGVLLGAYWRSFRNASPGLDLDDLGEGAVVARPTVWFGKIAGLSVEGTYEAQRRGVLLGHGSSAKPLFAQVGRIGVVPFLTPAGRGNYARPHFQFIYLMTLRDANARKLYAQDDVFHLRSVDHFIGIAAEWWLGSTSYFRD